MCGPKFCSMELTQQVRGMAAVTEAGADQAAAKVGMEEKSREFLEKGATIYLRQP
jgi:phosphomethylpyrimidine synthase